MVLKSFFALARSAWYFPVACWLRYWLTQPARPLERPAAVTGFGCDTVTARAFNGRYRDPRLGRPRATRPLVTAIVDSSWSAGSTTPAVDAAHARTVGFLMSRYN